MRFEADPAHPIPRETEATGRVVLDAAFEVHTGIGAGLLERVYRECLAATLEDWGHEVAKERAFPLLYRNRLHDAAFRPDLVIDERVVVEVKAVEAIHPVHLAQTATYLRLGGFNLGFVLNFHAPHLRDGIRRVVWTE